jgi:hypothetical protein
LRGNSKLGNLQQVHHNHCSEFVQAYCYTSAGHPLSLYSFAVVYFCVLPISLLSHASNASSELGVLGGRWDTFYYTPTGTPGWHTREVCYTPTGTPGTPGWQTREVYYTPSGSAPPV